MKIFTFDKKEKVFYDASEFKFYKRTKTRRKKIILHVQKHSPQQAWFFQAAF